jgi:hypothetical protein
MWNLIPIGNGLFLARFIPVAGAAGGGGLLFMLIPFIYLWFKYSFTESLLVHLLFFAINVVVLGLLLFILAMIFEILEKTNILEYIIFAGAVYVAIQAFLYLYSDVEMNFLVALLLTLPLMVFYASMFYVALLGGFVWGEYHIFIYSMDLII